MRKELEREAAKLDEAYSKSSATFALFKSSLITAIFLVSPVVLFFLTIMFTPLLGWSIEIQLLAGILTVVLGFFGIMFYYYSNAASLFGKTALSLQHWINPSETIAASPVISQLVHLGLFKTKNKSALHYTYVTFEEGGFPDMLLMSEGHPNEMIVPSPDWIVYHNLIYPASVAPLDTVELRKTELGLDEKVPLVVAKVVASAYHAREIQEAGDRMIKMNNPGRSDVNDALEALGAFKALEYREKWMQAEGELSVQKRISEDFKKRVAKEATELMELEEEGKKLRPGFLERLKGIHPYTRKLFLICGVIAVIAVTIITLLWVV